MNKYRFTLECHNKNIIEVGVDAVNETTARQFVKDMYPCHKLVSLANVTTSSLELLSLKHNEWLEAKLKAYRLQLEYYELFLKVQDAEREADKAYEAYEQEQNKYIETIGKEGK